MMPLMEGRAMIRALKKLEPGIKIIALSGLLDPGYLEETPELAAVQLMQKPFSTDKLLLSVWHALHQSH